MFKITILDTFMDREINMQINNEKVYYKDWTMEDTQEVTLMNLSNFHILNCSVVDEMTSQWQRFSNNLFQYIRARIENFIDDKTSNQHTFYLLKNFVDLQETNKNNSFTFQIKDLSKSSSTIFNKYILLIEEI